MDEQKLECGECTACCTIMGVKELQKTANTRCQHQCKEGCSIYGRHPQSCQDFQCLWVQGMFGIYTEMRPDNLGLMFRGMQGSKFTAPGEALIVCHEVWPGAFQSQEAISLLELLSKKTLVMLMTREDRKFIGPAEDLQRVKEIIAKTLKEKLGKINLL